MGDLNALANHYGVDVDQRHTALGDVAVTTGQIFCSHAALTSAARSINTLADARVPGRSLDEIRLSTKHGRAGSMSRRS